jgi:hypothetical protein
MDCIGNDETANFCAKVLSSKGGRYHSLTVPLPTVFKTQRPENTVKATTAVAYTLLGEAFWWRQPKVDFPAMPEEYAFGLGWRDRVQKWLDEGKLQPHPPEVKHGGLDTVLEQVILTKSLGPSGKKIVVLA